MNELAIHIERLEIKQPGIIEDIFQDLEEIRMQVERECVEGILAFFEGINHMAPPGQGRDKHRAGRPPNINTIL